MSINIVERLRDQGLVIQHPERKQIADLIEQQARRIKELEAERDSWKQEFRDAYRRETKMEVELAALRKRIDDAPVVVWQYKRGGETFNFMFYEPTPSDWNSCIPLISKEDLK